MIQRNSASLIDEEIRDKYVRIKKKSATSSDIQPSARLIDSEIQYSISAGWHWFRQIQSDWLTKN